MPLTFFGVQGFSRGSVPILRSSSHRNNPLYVYVLIAYVVSSVMAALPLSIMPRLVSSSSFYFTGYICMPFIRSVAFVDAAEFAQRRSSDISSLLSSLTPCDCYTLLLSDGFWKMFQLAECCVWSLHDARRCRCVKRSNMKCAAMDILIFPSVIYLRFQARTRTWPRA